MKNFLSISGLVGVILLLIAGCASSPSTRFYVLAPSPDIKAMAGQTNEGCPNIGVGPIVMPAHLVKLPIATTSSDNEVVYAPFDQWAEPLPGNISHVLAENLSKLVCNKAVYQFPWTGAYKADYRVRVEVISMTGKLDSKASMEAWWTITDPDGQKVIASGRTGYSAPVSSADYRALAQAYSTILASLSKDIAKAIPKR